MCMGETTKTKLSAEHESQLRQLVERVGVDRAAKALSTTRTVLTGALAGLTMRRTTAEGLTQALVALSTSPGRQEYVVRLEVQHRPVGMFLAQCCELNPGASVGALLLFQAWERWCEPKGVASRTRGVFEQRLLEAAPSVSAVRASPAAKQAVVYSGVRLKP